MLGSEFISSVKVKLNRIDTSAYEDVRPEEVLFFGWDALKNLILKFDTPDFRGFQGEETIRVYLASLTKVGPELTLINSQVDLPPEIFKIKDVNVYVEVDDEKGWQPTREEDNIKPTLDDYNPFLQSYPDMPAYRLIEDKIVFEVSDFVCTKMKYLYLEYPPVITEATDLNMPFIMELQDTTVKLILENLESRRIQSQPIVSKS